MRSELFVSALLSYLLVRNTSAGSPIYEAVEDDVAADSYIHEVRQLAPLKVAAEVEDLMSAGNAPKSRDVKKRMKNASGKSDEGGYYRSYGSDAEGEKGYLKETYGKDDQGYKTLDTFHKQDGDKYEFETQTTYGKAHTGDDKKKHSKKKDHEGAGTMVDTDYAGSEMDHDEGNEYSHYTTGSDEGDHYNDAYSGHTEEEPESTNYDHRENYSSGDNGSYETHGSYDSRDNGEEGEEESHY